MTGSNASDWFREVTNNSRVMRSEGRERPNTLLTWAHREREFRLHHLTPHQNTNGSNFGAWSIWIQIRIAKYAIFSLLHQICLFFLSHVGSHALLFYVFCVAGVGTRNYYRKMGYELEGPYMLKDLHGPGTDWACRCFYLDGAQRFTCKHAHRWYYFSKP